jgi:cell division protein FtsB
MHVNDVVQNVKNEAGVRIRELEADVEELRDENERLRVQIAELKDKVDDLGES